MSIVSSLKSRDKAENIAQKVSVLRLLGDNTRFKIMCFMFEKKHACVSKIAKVLSISVANTSYHLQLLKKGGFFKTHRMGNEICYKLMKDDFIKKLENLICE